MDCTIHVHTNAVMKMLRLHISLRRVEPKIVNTRVRCVYATATLCVYDIPEPSVSETFP